MPFKNVPFGTTCKKVHYASQHPLELRSGSASQQNPTARPTGPCLTGESGHAFRPRADRQAPLDPLALSASGHERAVNSCAMASGEKRLDFSAAIARFGDILNIEGLLVEIVPRSVFGNSAVGVMQAPGGGGFAHDLTPLVPAEGGVGREARG